MAKVVVMPKLGLTMTEGTISSWLKKEGDAVKQGEPMFEVETDKLTNTIEAPESGILRKIIVAEGVTVPVLDKIAVIAAADEDISGLLSGGAAPAPALLLRLLRLPPLLPRRLPPASALWPRPEPRSLPRTRAST
jgi:pyruvate dehydrogenase E2 component (dihydrolipoamide acetyltransferase)